MAANPWDNDAVVTPAPTSGAASSGSNPWDADTVVTPAASAGAPWSNDAQAPQGSALDAYKANPTAGNAYRAAMEVMDLNHPVAGTLSGFGRTIIAGAAGTVGKLAGRVRDVLPGGADWNPGQPRAADTFGEAAANAVPSVGPTGQAVENALATGAQTVGRAVDQIPGVNTPLGQTLKEAIPEAAADVGLLYGLRGAAREVPASLGGPARAPVAAAPSAAAASAPVDAAAAAADTMGASAATPPKFESAPPSVSGADTAATEGPLNSADQAQRAETLRAVGLDDKDIRTSAVSGDKKAGATDYQQAKLDNEGGEVLANGFSKERDALGAHTDSLIADAGGSAGLDETSLHNRGATIVQPLENLKDAFDSKISDLYAQADAKAQGVPLDLTSTAKVLADKPQFIGTVEGQQLLRGINAYLQQAGVADEAGTVGSATVQQAERLKQYLNQQWTPQTGRLIRGVKDAVDDDVTSAAGGDVYAQARALRTARANMLDNPKGVASLLDTSGPGGINRAVAVEKVPDAVARMPVDQFGHVVDTLNHVSSAPELSSLAPQAQAALGEIRSQFMLRLQEQAQKLKGAWNNKGVTQYLSANSAKLAKVFSPNELARMKTLNDAGNILDVDRSYPGAAVQGHNLVQRGALAAIEHGAGVVGAHIGGPPGAFVGEIAGKAAAKALGGSFSKKAARARFLKP